MVAWQDLFHARQQWATAVADDCASKAGAAQERYSEMDAMMRCLDAAVANLEAVVKGVDTKYTDIKKWVGSAQVDYSNLATRWEEYLDLARSVAISPAMLKFMAGPEGGASGKGKGTRHQQSQQLLQQQTATLEDLIDIDIARKAGKLAPAALRRFNTKIADLERAAPQLFQGCEDVLQSFERAVDRSALSHEGESTQLLQDIKAVANKIDTDYRTTLEYTDSTRDVLQASKIAATHTERLLPSIKTRAMEMDEMFRYATQARNALALETVDFMRTITDLTSLSSDVKAQISAMSEEDDMVHFDYLRLVQQIPFVYASFVSEAIKRREWLDKVKTDSSTLANEMALFHDEEVKRRKKWQKSVGNLVYGPSSTSAEHQVAGLEVNLLGEEAEWPSVTRKDLEDLYGVLQRQKADGGLIEDIGKMITELNVPTRQQSKRIKAFKNGSVHEAALGRSGLLIRGDDDVLRSLQDDKAKLENKLRTAESRVRRLEDLLHRQTQASRSSLAGVFQTAPSQQLSDRAESTASVKPGTPRLPGDRRTSLESGSTTAAAVELRMAHRIQQLEADLAAEKGRSAAFEKDLQARNTENTAILGQMDETNSTKKDLLENLEALKREFTEERKSLEDEIKRLQVRLEDTEDEMEHFGESRETEKATYDEKMRALQADLERLTKEHRDEVLKGQGQVDFLRKETKLQREQNESLEKQLQAANDEAQATAKRLQQTVDTEAMYAKGFRDLHEQLAVSDGSSTTTSQPSQKKVAAVAAPPTDAADLVEAVSGRLADALTRLQTAASDMVIVRADLERAEAGNQDLRNELAAAKDALVAEESAARGLREQLAEEKERMTALEEELSGSRADLHQLRTKITDGETGSEVLRKRLEDEEKKVLSLTEELAAKQSHLGSIEEELRLFQEKYADTQATLTSLAARFDARTLRAKDLSQRLYTQNDRLCRVLERLGFSVSREGDFMVIQKVPRAERSALIGGEGASSLLRRSTGGLLQTQAAGEASSTAAAAPTAPTPASTGDQATLPDVAILYWMNSADGDTEAAKYAEYMAAVGSFDIDAVAETIYRRVKEVEHIARKLQRDVRSYREKAHALQKDAHSKIAFKNFKEGDLALFLPTRNQTNGAWAAFNIGSPHYFLREQESHRLQNREWLVARISRVQEKMVDLSKSLHGQQQAAAAAATATAETASLSTEDNDNDNPFDLSDGLRWYLIDAQEDKPGAPSTPGLGKSTVAANHVEAVADIHTHARTPSGRGLGGLGLGGGGSARASGIDGVSKTLTRNLESRRSSTSSTRRAAPALAHVAAAAAALRGSGTAVASETNSLRSAAATSPPNNTVAATTTPSVAISPPTEQTPSPGGRDGTGTGGASAAAATASGTPPTSEVRTTDSLSPPPAAREPASIVDSLLGP